MIYTECNPDTALVKFLGIPKKQVIHLQGKPEVCKQLEKREYWKGMIDEDPFSVQPYSYLNKLQEATGLLTVFGLKVLHDATKNNDLIVLSPKLEGWILKAAKDAKIDIKQYNLPEDEEKLRDELKLKNLAKFEKLVNDLKEKSEMVKALERLLKE
jgi:hypothetical protein